jgi:hypothetical protein
VVTHCSLDTETKELLLVPAIALSLVFAVEGTLCSCGVKVEGLYQGWQLGRQSSLME